MKLTLYTTDESCADIISIKCSHITMFEKNILHITFLNIGQMMPLVEKLIEHFVLFQIQGTHVYIIPESNNTQRVRFRFDND